jgi:hypothetical protein
MDFAGAARLEQIRASLGGDSSDTQALTGSAPKAVEAGNGTTTDAETTDEGATSPQTSSAPQPADPA